MLFRSARAPRKREAESAGPLTVSDPVACSPCTDCPLVEPCNTSPSTASPLSAASRRAPAVPEHELSQRDAKARARPVALELFSGSGRLSEALKLLGWETREYDLSISSEHDLLRPALQRMIIASISRGEVSYVHLGPPCSSFSVARTPPVRNRLHPYGVPELGEKDREKLRAGNALALFSLRVMKTCLPLGDRKSTRLNSSHSQQSRMPSSA